MTETGRYNRETVLLGCLVAWTCGMATGAILGLAYGKPDAPPPPGDSSMTFTTIPDSAPPAMPVPTPPENEWAVPLYIPHDQRDCPRLDAKELMVREDEDQRTVVLSARLTNGDPATTCTIPADAISIRDGDGTVFNHDAGDIHVAPLGAKWGRFSFRLPRNLDIATIVVRAPGGRLERREVDLTRPVRQPHAYGGR